MNSVREKSTDAIMDEAADWLVCMSAPDVSLKERRAFVAWLKRSPVHVDEYLRVESTWADLGNVDRAARIDIARLLAEDSSNIVDFNVTGELPAGVRSGAAGSKARAPGRFLRGFKSLPALAASLVLMAVAAVWLYQSGLYATGTGEQRTVKLDEGSTVVLNTRTRLRIDFNADARTVRLLEGEALFKVAKDTARPFRVFSDRAVAQAIGTEFVVRKQTTRTQVTVIEGQVAVARAVEGMRLAPGAVPAMARHVYGGARAIVEDREIKTQTVANPAAVLAWQSRRLIFEGESLASAVAEFNRYNDVQLVLEDSRLSSERLSGVFDADQPQSLARFLERAGVISEPQISGATIVLRPIVSSPR